MLKKILTGLALTFSACCFAAIDVNTGTEAELDGVNGIGPAMSRRIIDERKKADFKDWNDFMRRVKGVGKKSAARLSQAGLTVNGTGYHPGPVASAEKQAARN